MRLVDLDLYGVILVGTVGGWGPGFTQSSPRVSIQEIHFTQGRQGRKDHNKQVSRKVRQRFLFRKSISRKNAKAQRIITSRFRAKYAKGFYSGNPFRAKTPRRKGSCRASFTQSTPRVSIQEIHFTQSTPRRKGSYRAGPFFSSRLATWFRRAHSGRALILRPIPGLGGRARWVPDGLRRGL
jgi:hypothetical protein